MEIIDILELYSLNYLSVTNSDPDNILVIAVRLNRFILDFRVIKQILNAFVNPEIIINRKYLDSIPIDSKIIDNILEELQK